MLTYEEMRDFVRKSDALGVPTLDGLGPVGGRGHNAIEEFVEGKSIVPRTALLAHPKFVGGDFTSIGGQSRSRIAAVSLAVAVAGYAMLVALGFVLRAIAGVQGRLHERLEPSAGHEHLRLADLRRIRRVAFHPILRWPAAEVERIRQGLIAAGLLKAEQRPRRVA